MIIQPRHLIRMWSIPAGLFGPVDGTTTKSNVSIREYFERLGIGKYYTQGSTDPQMFKQMQYATMNYLGFIGYQLSEQDFWDLGYYTHYDENHLLNIIPTCRCQIGPTACGIRS